MGALGRGRARAPRGSAPSRRRRPAPRRLLPLILTLGVILSQIVGLGHNVLVAHSRCDHGAFIHEAEHAVVPTATSVAEHHHGNAVVQGGAGSEDDHEHCDPFAVTPGLTSVNPVSAPLALVHGEVLPWSVRPASERTVAILSLAPKNSPPV